MAEPVDDRRRVLAQAGLWISAGLVVQVMTLFWSQPTAFLVFIGIGSLLLAIGIARYLWLVLAGQADRGQPRIEG